VPSPCPAGTPSLSEPAIDIVEGDIVQNGTDLLFHVTVDDLGAVPLQDATRHYAFETTYAGKLVQVTVGPVASGETTATGEIFVRDPLAPTAPHRAVDVTLDYATDTVEFTVPLSVANDVLAEACATCTPLGTGSTFQDFWAQATYQANAADIVMVSGCSTARCDRAEATGTFTLA